MHKWTTVHALIFHSASYCALWCFSYPSVLTSRYTHPLPQYGDIHRSDMGKQHKHTSLEALTYKHAETHNLPDCAENHCRHQFWISKMKTLCIAGREVVTASLVLTSPPNSRQDVEEEMSQRHQKTKQGLGKKIKVTFTQTLGTISTTFRRDADYQSLLIAWVTLSVSAPMIISKERQP